MKKFLLFMMFIFLISCGGGKEALEEEQSEEQKVQGEEAAVSDVPSIVMSNLHFLPSYQEYGGPHILIDSLNIVIPISDADFMDMVRFSTREYKKLKRVSTVKPPQKGKAVSSKKLKKGKVERKIKPPDKKVLEVSYLPAWDILNNKAVFYEGNIEVNLPPKVKVYKDKNKKFHYIDYYGKDSKVAICKGTFYYAKSGVILEQRIEFAEKGELTDISPYYFDLRFNLIKPEWIVKCLYSNENKLKKVIVMDDFGNIFYSYRFQYVDNKDFKFTVVKVFDKENRKAGSYELFCDKWGMVEKRVEYDENRRRKGYKLYTSDLEKREIIVDSYDNEGNHIVRIRQNL